MAERGSSFFFVSLSTFVPRAHALCLLMVAGHCSSAKYAGCRRLGGDGSPWCGRAGQEAGGGLPRVWTGWHGGVSQRQMEVARDGGERRGRRGPWPAQRQMEGCEPATSVGSEEDADWGR